MLEFVMSCPEAINICNNKTFFFLLKLEASYEGGWLSVYPENEYQNVLCENFQP